ncbi:MAG: hypothetical protein ACJ8FN_07165 [Sphingomicrobium sp.]
MRFLFPVMLGIGAAAVAQPAAFAQPGQRAALIAGSQCPETTKYLTGRSGAWRGDHVRPRKLTELPRAEAFAAVYRLDERGCMVPVLYRDVRAARR